MKFEKKHVIYILISVFISLGMFGLYNGTKLLDSLELKSINGMFFMRDETPGKTAEGVVKKNIHLSDNIIIIGIDDRALQQFGRFPWNRSVYSKFLNKLQGAKPASIFFDIAFPEYSVKTEDDIFFNALRLHKDKNIFSELYFERLADSIDINSIKNRLKLLDAFSYDPVSQDKVLVPYNNGAFPVVEVIKNVKGIGHANATLDTDATARKLAIFAKFNNQLYPHVVFLVALNYFQVPRENVVIKLGENILLKAAKVPIKDDFGEVVNYKVQDVKIPIDESGRVIINYVGYPNEFIRQSQYLSFVDVFNVPAEYFNNKVLFVGMYAQGIVHDAWPTPHGSIMYGIEINANALNTIIQRDFLTTAPQWINFLIIIFFGLLIGFLMPRMQIWQSALAILISIILLFIIVFFVMFDGKNTILLFATPLLSIVFSFIGTLLYRILTEEKEKKFIKQRFSSYVSKNVVDELLKNPKALQLGGEDRFMSVFFSDIRGFTTISEQLGEPQKLVALINEYLSAMTEIIIYFNGTLDKYVGDEVMAFWGAPIPQENHAYLACKTALVQMKYLKEVLDVRFEKEGKPKLDIGIGVNSGKMTVGNMGSKSRMDYTLMGDEVNLGARLEGTNKVYGTHIIISEQTYEEVKDKVIARELDLIRVKGKKKPVRIFELIDLKDEEIIIPSI